MSRYQGRYFVAIIVLASAVLGAVFVSQRDRLLGAPAGDYEFVTDIDNWRRTDRERAVASPFDFNLGGDLSALPLTLGKWIGEDVPQTNLEVFILLEPEQYVQRLYSQPDGKAVWLSLIGSRKSKSFHSPQICYDTDGWQTDAGSETVTLAGGELYTLRLVAKKTFSEGGEVQQAVLYFYLWPSYARNPRDGMVLVKVTAPVYDSVENAVALEKDFIRELLTSARQ